MRMARRDDVTAGVIGMRMNGIVLATGTSVNGSVARVNVNVNVASVSVSVTRVNGIVLVIGTVSNAKRPRRPRRGNARTAMSPGTRRSRRRVTARVCLGAG